MTFIVALLGAESTGKTTLSQQLAEALRAEGWRVAVVAEYLREFCERSARVPLSTEQTAIAAEQSRRIAAATQDHDIVVADTTALMIAVYSDLIFADTSLYDNALRDHARCDLTLLTALDIPWQPDGLQREGPHVQGPVDALIRAALQRGRIDHAVVAGSGEARSAAALSAVRHAMRSHDAAPTTQARWHWQCAHCGDTACERHGLLKLN